MPFKTSFFYKTLGTAVAAGSSIGGVIFGVLEKQKNSSLSTKLTNKDKEIEELNKKPENQEGEKIKQLEAKIKEYETTKEDPNAKMKNFASVLVKGLKVEGFTHYYDGYIPSIGYGQWSWSLCETTDGSLGLVSYNQTTFPDVCKKEKNKFGSPLNIKKLEEYSKSK